MRISDWSSDVCSSDLKKAPKCVAMRDIMGMQAVQRDSIDLITRQNRRLRAQLNRGCRALDFYAGFYMKGNKDGRLCEDRDEIHARTGARCEIGRAHACTPVTHAQLVCRLLLAKKKAD